MGKKRQKYSRIPVSKETVSPAKKVTGIRFKFGFSRVKSKKSQKEGRLSFLLTDFKKREDYENTRFSVNYHQLKNSDIIIHKDLRESALPDSYSFLIITDPHIKPSNTRFIEKFPKACLESDAFVVFTGDATTKGTEEQLKLFYTYILKMPLPVYPVVGNHDIYGHNWNTWQKYMGQSIYRIDSGSTTLIMLDSANGLLGSRQIEWLDQQLNFVREHVFVFSHCNFFIPTHTVLQQFSNFKERSRVINVCKDRVEAVFTGHSHKLYSHVAKGVPYINLDDFRDKGTYCRVNVSKKGFQCTYGSIADIE